MNLGICTAVSSEAWAKLRDWASVAGRGRLLLSGSVAHASLKTAVVTLKTSPQGEFTAIMKEIIIECATFLKKKIKIIRKDFSVHTKRTFNLREIEDKVSQSKCQYRVVTICCGSEWILY